MNRIDVLLKKYETLNREWGSISTAMSICFSVGVVGFVMGLVFMNLVIIITTYAFMSLFAVYDFKIRKIYIESKHSLEKEMFKLAKIKPVKIKEVAEKTIFG